MPPECPTARGIASLEGHEGDLVQFREFLADMADYTSRLVLVNCSSRQGVMVMGIDQDWVSYNAASELFERAMQPGARFDPDRLFAQAQSQGFDATRVELSAGHCGCDLPNIEPQFSCPEM